MWSAETGGSSAKQLAGRQAFFGYKKTRKPFPFTVVSDFPSPPRHTVDRLVATKCSPEPAAAVSTMPPHTFAQAKAKINHIAGNSFNENEWSALAA